MFDKFLFFMAIPLSNHIVPTFVLQKLIQVLFLDYKQPQTRDTASHNLEKRSLSPKGPKELRVLFVKTFQVCTLGEEGNWNRLNRGMPPRPRCEPHGGSCLDQQGEGPDQHKDFDRGRRAAAAAGCLKQCASRSVTLIKVLR